MADVTLFKQYLQLADQLAQVASKEELAECARLLALNLAHYELRYGMLPIDEVLDAAYSDEPNDQQIELVTKGMETMVGVLGGIVIPDTAVENSGHGEVIAAGAGELLKMASYARSMSRLVTRCCSVNTPAKP